MARFKDREWELHTTEYGRIGSWEALHAALMMDLRDELKAIRRLMECPNVQAGFIAMQKAAKNTEKRKRPVRK